MNIEKLLDRLFIEVDCAAVIEQIIHDEIVDPEKIISLIFRQSRESNAEAQLHLLAKTLATLCLKTQSLDYIERQMGTISDDVPNSTEKNFIRKTLAKIGEWFILSEEWDEDSKWCFFSYREYHWSEWSQSIGHSTLETICSPMFNRLWILTHGHSKSYSRTQSPFPVRLFPRGSSIFFLHVPRRSFCFR